MKLDIFIFTLFAVNELTFKRFLKKVKTQQYCQTFDRRLITENVDMNCASSAVISYYWTVFRRAPLKKISAPTNEGQEGQHSCYHCRVTTPYTRENL